MSGWGWFPYVWILATEDATKVEEVLLLNHLSALTIVAYLIDKSETERFNYEQSRKG